MRYPTRLAAVCSSPAPVMNAILMYAFKRSTKLLPCTIRLSLTPPIITATKASAFNTFIADFLACPFLVYVMSQSLHVGNMQRTANQI
jgi:flagellar biosynthesis protein FliR